jgi:hypothetical protein
MIAAEDAVVVLDPLLEVAHIERPRIHRVYTEWNPPHEIDSIFAALASSKPHLWRAWDGSEARVRRSALHCQHAIGRERPVHDRDGDEDSLRRPRLMHRRPLPFG